MTTYPKDAAQEAIEALKLTGKFSLSSANKFKIQEWVQKKYPHMGIISHPTIYNGFGQAKVVKAQAALKQVGLHFKVYHSFSQVYIREQGKIDVIRELVEEIRKLNC